MCYGLEDAASIFRQRYLGQLLQLLKAVRTKLYDARGQSYQSVSPGMPKRGLGTQAAVFTVLVVCVVAAIGVVSLTQSEEISTASSNEGTLATTSTAEATTCAPSPGESGNANVTITQTAGQWPPCSCALVDSNSNGTLYVSTNAVVGDDVCIAASMSASPIVSFKVLGPTGGVFLPGGGCVNSSGTAVSCATSWNTAQLYPGGSQVQPGDYELIATGDSQSLRANFTLSANSSTSSQTCIDQSSSSSTSSSNGQGHYVASAVTPNVFFNNSIYQGPPVKFTVVPGSHATMVVNVSYPWQNVQPPPAQGFCVEFSFTVGPFPASSNASTIPSWMHVSISPPSVEIPYGSNAFVNLLARVDNTVPQDSSVSFELLIHYLDPASGNAVIGSYIVSIQA